MNAIGNLKKTFGAANKLQKANKHAFKQTHKHSINQTLKQLQIQDNAYGEFWCRVFGNIFLNGFAENK